MKPMVWLALAALSFGAQAAEEESTPCDNVETSQQSYDCAVDTFPAVTGTKAYAIAQNDCLARMSDERSEFLESIGQE